MVRSVFCIAFLLILSCGAFGQSTDTRPSGQQLAAFEIADVHPSAHRRSPHMSGPDFRDGLYMIRDATMIDLITTAYTIDGDNVLGGPAWLETDRFDVIAKAPQTPPPDNLKLMLQALLADRFRLVEHADTKPLRVYVLSVSKGGKPKMREAADLDNGGCKPGDEGPAAPGTIPQLLVSCHGITMDALADALRDMSGGYLTKAVVNSTGLEGAWDLDLRWTARGDLARAGGDGISFFDAVDKELGLRLDLEEMPRAAIVVDSVDEAPTRNSPDVTRILPPAPTKFEVAVIKPTDPNNRDLLGGTQGGQIEFDGNTLKWLIQYAWRGDIDPSDDELLVNAPKWLDADHWDILAKADTELSKIVAGRYVWDQEDLQQMLRELLIDRFKLQVHMEVRPVSAYTLKADTPRLEKSTDPLERTRCYEGPGKDGKDPRIANPLLSRLITCQNMNMAEFSAKLADLAPAYIHVPVKDDTGLQGGYDLTLSFSGTNFLPGAPSGGTAPQTDGSASEPNGASAITLFDAVNKELGLKLVKERRPAPVLVIDHIERTPTPN